MNLYVEMLDVVSSKIELVYDGSEKEFENGAALCDVLKGKTLAVKDISAKDGGVVVVAETFVPSYPDTTLNWYKEEVAKTGREPSSFDGV